MNPYLVSRATKLLSFYGIAQCEVRYFENSVVPVICVRICVASSGCMARQVGFVLFSVNGKETVLWRKLWTISRPQC